MKWKLFGAVLPALTQAIYKNNEQDLEESECNKIINGVFIVDDITGNKCYTTYWIEGDIARVCSSGCASWNKCLTAEQAEIQEEGCKHIYTDKEDEDDWDK